MYVYSHIHIHTHTHTYVTACISNKHNNDSDKNIKITTMLTLGQDISEVRHLRHPSGDHRSSGLQSAVCYFNFRGRQTHVPPTADQVQAYRA